MYCTKWTNFAKVNWSILCMYKAHQLMVMDEQSSTKGIFKKLINIYKIEYFTETTQVAMSEEGR